MATKGLSLRGKVWHVDYWFKGQHIKFSTGETDEKKAANQLAMDRSERLQGRLGIVDRQKEDDKIPTLAEFIAKDFEPYARDQWERTKLKKKTWSGWIGPSIRAILAFPELAQTKITQITKKEIIRFRSRRSDMGNKPNTVNSRLRALRLMLQHAIEIGILTARPSFKKLMMPGEESRDRVLTSREEARYLFCAPELLADVATLMVDTGLRPEEVERLEWKNVYWDRGRRGMIHTKFGKSKKAHRILGLTKRTREILERRFATRDKQWVFPNADTESGHIEPSSLKGLHEKTFEMIAEQCKGTNEMPIEPFVLYTLRHTMLTRLATTPLADGSKIDVHTFMLIAGHNSIQMSLRYVHPDFALVVGAMENFADRLDTENSVKILTNASPVDDRPVVKN